MNPQRLGRVAVLFACGLFLLASCSNDLGITVFYHQTHGLKPDDPVRWQDQQIGAVTAVEVNPQGRVAVRLRIQSAFRSKVTDQCRFVLMKNAHQPDQRVVKLACLAEGGTPLSHGAEVEGSTTWGFLLEQGRQGLRAWSEQLKAEVARWEQALKRLPVEAWGEQIEDRMVYWTRELEQASEETRRYFKQEVLPALEEAFKKLKQHLSEQGRQDDIRTLERKLEALKQI